MTAEQEQRRGHCQSVAPGMPSADMDRTAGHYRCLGFDVHRFGDGFLIAERDQIALHFALKRDHDPARTATWIWVHVDDPDALHEEWKAAGAERLRPPQVTDYKTYEGCHIDPDGNMILFGRSASSSAT
ncbi:MAG TPA: VOC family protein [Candidatus Dormibacteraeota bacterium]|nr:VOC family protein [Candidatus Dormibacteraeota bacterium]